MDLLVTYLTLYQPMPTLAFCCHLSGNADLVALLTQGSKPKPQLNTTSTSSDATDRLRPFQTKYTSADECTNPKLHSSVERIMLSYRVALVPGHSPENRAVTKRLYGHSRGFKFVPPFRIRVVGMCGRGTISVEALWPEARSGEFIWVCAFSRELD